MKKIVKYIALIIIPVLFFSCEKPSPTELISSDIDIPDIQTISNDTEVYIYSNGYDTTGITSTVPQASSVISLSLSKITAGSQTSNVTLAEAYFFDKSKPVKTHSNKTVGFRTKTPGTVLFGKKKARVTDFRVKYKDQGMVKDTALGQYYLLHKRGKSGDQLNFVHGSIVNFELQTDSSPFQTEIPTPEEISGAVEISGSRHNSNLEFNLKWNKTDQDTIEIIIGGKIKGSQAVFPFFKLNAPDNGKLKIPAFLLKNFPFARFDKIVFTFIRKKIKVIDPNSILGDNYISARSIHSIYIDIPE
jgi:hypothetical protein